MTTKRVHKRPSNAGGIATCVFEVKDGRIDVGLLGLVRNAN